MLKNNNQFGVWTRPFLREASYSERKACAKFSYDQFMARVQLCPEDDLAIINWVNSAEGQATLLTLVQDIQWHIVSVKESALPAHDIRQILFKDAAEGLRFAQREKLTDIDLTFLVPMVSHDIGRLLEGAFYDSKLPHNQWIPHAQLSYLLLKAILDKPDYRDMPSGLKNHFLYAVAAHSGDNGKTFMSRAVQTCDRMQLIGAEGFFRALSYGVCLTGGRINYPVWKSFAHDLPDMNEHTSVISLLEYFARNMRQNEGTENGHKQWQRQVAVENVAILLALCHGNDELYKKVFARELNPTQEFGERKKRIPADILAEAQKLFSPIPETDGCTSQFELTRRIFKDLQGVKGAAPLTEDMKQSISRAMDILMANERAGLYQALGFAEKLRDQQDEADIVVCHQVMEQHPNTYLSAIAEKALEYAPEHLLEASISYGARATGRVATVSSPPTSCVPR